MSSVESSSDLSQSQEATLDVGKINEIQHYIENLDDRESRNKFSEELTKSVIDALSKIPPETKSKLADSFKNVYEKNKNDPDFQKLTVQITKLAESFWLNIDGTSVVADTTSDQQTDTTSEAIGVILPEFPLEWVLEWIEEWEDGKRTNVTYSQLMRNKPELQDWQEDKTLEWKRLYDTIDWIESQLTTINEFLQNDKLKENESIKWLGEILKNIQNALNNTTVVNVRKLQDFIFNNLDWDSYQEEFKSKNHRREWRGFDWQFWESSLKWLDIVLGKTKNYLDGVSDKLKESKDQEDVQKLNAVKANSDVNYVQWSWDANLKSWLTDLPDWATVDFKDDNEKAKLNTSWSPTITLKISFNWKEREISVTVNVTDGSSPEQDSDGSAEQNRRQPETQPLSVDGKQYLPMEEKPCSHPEWAVFYSAKAYSPEITSEEGSDSQSTEVQPKFTNVTETAEGDGDSIYLMRMGENVYKVKVDGKWNICPTAINMISNVAVVMNNSGSGKAYIENKLHPVLQGKWIVIWWNWEDYTISLPSWWKDLTIEPMTIDWKWIWSLTDSLAFLNLTNYLRNSWKMNDIEFKNDNPDLKLEWKDLYVKVKNTRDINWKKVKWLKVNKDTFWLPNDEKLLKKYIKYNNGEDWEDDWDKKKPNKYYKHVELQ